MTDRLKSLSPCLVRLPPCLWTTRQTPRVPSDPHRAPVASDVKSAPERKGKPLELAPTATAWRAGPPRATGRRAEPIQSPVHISHAYSPNHISFFHTLATNNTEMEPIVAVHANTLSPTGPGLATEPPRYRRVATAPMPALVPNIPRLCGFPGRGTGFEAQRGLCRPPIIKRCGL